MVEAFISVTYEYFSRVFGHKNHRSVSLFSNPQHTLVTFEKDREEYGDLSLSPSETSKHSDVGKHP